MGNPNKSKKFWFFGVGSFLFLFIILFLVAWYFSSVLLQPAEFTCKLNHYTYCNDPKSDLGLDFEDVEFISEDGLRLSAWYIPGSTKSQKAVISVHGRGGDRREGLRYLPTIHELGVNVLMLDLRNNGKSQKSFNSMTYHEKKDVKAGLTFLQKEKNQNSIGILGFSMGGATSIIAMADNPEIKVGIFDSPFADFERVISENAKSMYGLPKYPLLPLVVFLYEIRGSLKVREMSPMKRIGEISPRPILLLHGTADTQVFYEHSVTLLENAKDPKELLTVTGGEHTKLWQVDTDRIRKKVVEYYGNHL